MTSREKSWGKWHKEGYKFRQKYIDELRDAYFAGWELRQRHDAEVARNTCQCGECNECLACAIAAAIEGSE